LTVLLQPESVGQYELGQKDDNKQKEKTGSTQKAQTK
jgi:hypothetical protein